MNFFRIIYKLALQLHVPLYSLLFPTLSSTLKELSRLMTFQLPLILNGFWWSKGKSTCILLERLDTSDSNSPSHPGKVQIPYSLKGLSYQIPLSSSTNNIQMHKGCPRGGGGEASKLIDRLVSPKLSGDSVRPVSCRTCLPVYIHHFRLTRSSFLWIFLLR